VWNLFFCSTLLLQPGPGADAKDTPDFTPRYRFLFKNNTGKAAAFHTAIIEVKNAWIFEPLVPPLAVLPPSEVIPVSLDPERVPYDIRRNLSLSLKNDEIDHVQFVFKSESKKYDKQNAFVFLVNMKILYGKENRYIESGNKLVFIKNWGTGFDGTVDRAVKTMGAMSPNPERLRASLTAAVQRNQRNAAEVTKLIKGKVGFNNKLDVFLDEIRREK
jgi:hypothetical protein